MTRRMLVASLVATLALPASAGAAVHVQPSSTDATAVQKGVAAAIAAGDPAVMLEPGAYTAQTIQAQHATAAPVTITGIGAILGAVTVKASDGLTFDTLDFNGRLSIQTITGLTGPSHDIAVKRSRFLGGGVQIINNASNVTVENNLFLGSSAAVIGPGRINASYTSRHILIDGNVIQGSTDGIQFGYWDDVTIRDNAIRDLHDPRARTDPPTCHPAGTTDPSTPECIHNDAVQFTGPTEGATLEGNTVDGSDSQGFLIQAMNGPISNVVVRRNVLTNVSNAPISVEGVSPAALVESNTVFTNHPLSFPGIWFKSVTGRYETDAVAQWNTGCRVKIDAGNTVTVGANLNTC